MRYTYDSCNTSGFRVQTTTNLNEICPAEYSDGNYVVVHDNSKGSKVVELRCEDDILAWRETLARNEAWYSPKLDDKSPTEPVKDTYQAENTPPWTWAEKAPKTAPVSKVINPRHYKNYIDDMQWIDAMSKIPSYQDPKVFKGAVELQIRKYLDRNGKDCRLQELQKAQWYLKYLIAYIKEGKPIRAEAVDKILSE